MNLQVHLAIDAMGGDSGPEVTVPAAINALQADPHLSLTLVGNLSRISSFVPVDYPQERLKILACEGEVRMEDRLGQILRQGRDSSMGKAIELAANGTAQGCVSSGNTAALLALGLQIIKCFPPIDRPAICTALPNAHSRTWMLDMGANLECSAEQLHQFALMAHLLSQQLDGLKTPRLGLLNVGKESNKGTTKIQQAASLLKSDPNLNYCGFAEGDDLFSGQFDVIVTEGFTGNIALKSSEGSARFLLQNARKITGDSFRGKLGQWLLKPALKRFSAQMNPAKYNGAPFLGLKSTLVKSHGNADQVGFCCAIQLAAQLVRADWIMSLNDLFNAVSAKNE